MNDITNSTPTPNPAPLTRDASKDHAPFAMDPRVHKGVPELLEGKGFSPAAIEALLRFDASNFQWRRMWEKEEFSTKVLASLTDPLEPALVQGLMSIARISIGLGRPEPMQPTIGMVAEVMALDPSRASRIVSELVVRGYVERGVAQDDARKSVLHITPKGKNFMAEFSASKWMLMAQVFETWGEDDVAAFSALFERFVASLVDVVSARNDT